jgi:hypothetical protein
MAQKGGRYHTLRGGEGCPNKALPPLSLLPSPRGPCIDLVDFLVPGIAEGLLRMFQGSSSPFEAHHAMPTFLLFASPLLEKRPVLGAIENPNRLEKEATPWRLMHKLYSVPGQRPRSNIVWI